ncbi:MAG: prepilin peptidase, partial [Acidobacteria bacterium]|nr:prepilin peptidase [Acidobacteriota bacterium]
MVTLFLAFSVLVGLCVGSFANVLIYRLPNNLSIVTPASHCPKCNSPIPFYQNIPVFSYIFLLGKCAKCKNRIPIRYPLVEILVGVLFWFAAYNYIVVFPPTLLNIVQLFSLCIFLLFITVLMFIDLEHQILPDRLTIPGIFLGLLSSFILPFTTPLESLLGSILGATVPAILILVYA